MNMGNSLERSKMHFFPESYSINVISALFSIGVSQKLFSSRKNICFHDMQNDSESDSDLSAWTEVCHKKNLVADK